VFESAGLPSYNGALQGSGVDKKETVVRYVIAVAALVALSFSTTACLDTHSGLKKPDEEGKVARPIKEESVEFPKQWRRVGVGFKPKVKLAGFIRTDRERREDQVEKTYWVFDREFNKRGFFFDSGLAFRRDRVGEYKRVGVFDPDNCVAKILRLNGPINYYAMNPPEGSTTPFFDELNPKAKKLEGKKEGKGDAEDDES
jgi:hypothetical protein